LRLWRFRRLRAKPESLCLAGRKQESFKWLAHSPKLAGRLPWLHRISTMATADDDASTDAQALLRAALLSIHGPCPALAPTREPVEGVPGAYVLRGALSNAEATRLAAVVRAAHRSRAERLGLTAQPPRTGVTGAGGGGGDWRAEQPRRDSQHHVPLRASRDDMCALAARLREWLPQIAGPPAGCAAPLAPPGDEISTFLRCYLYKQGDVSNPHYDRSFREHAEPTAEAVAKGGRGARRGVLRRFSAFSVLLYLNDAFQGGCTTFFAPEPGGRRGRYTPLCSRDELAVVASVQPRCGDVLIFPHGTQHPGGRCYPDPLHEGSRILEGEKLLLRTDVVFDVVMTRQQQQQPQSPRPAAALQPAGAREESSRAPSPLDAAAAAAAAAEGARSTRMTEPAPEPQPLEVDPSPRSKAPLGMDVEPEQQLPTRPSQQPTGPQHSDATTISIFEGMLCRALRCVCPAYSHLAVGSAKDVSERGGPDLESAVAAAVYWKAYRDAQASRRAKAPAAKASACAPSRPGEPGGSGGGGSPAGHRGPQEARVAICSDYGVERHVTRAALAELIIDALPALAAGGGGGGEQPTTGGGGGGDDGGLPLAALRVAEGGSGTIQATTCARRAQMAAKGRVACERCGRYGEQGVSISMRPI
jgi:hypothetical protein